jgi:hypothetical protein
MDGETGQGALPCAGAKHGCFHHLPVYSDAHTLEMHVSLRHDVESCNMYHWPAAIKNHFCYQTFADMQSSHKIEEITFPRACQHSRVQTMMVNLA